MPTGLPAAHSLTNSEWFFSLDTEPIRAAGFRFSSGALSTLREQLPGYARLVITEIVKQEVLRQQLELVDESKAKLDNAIVGLEKAARITLTPIVDQIEKLSISANARQSFSRAIAVYLSDFRGSVLPISPDLAEKIFRDYFFTRPPFESSRNKKAEFPDSASLHLLEDHAATSSSFGILVSADAGWAAYCAQSPRLYCVTTVNALASLFASTGDLAERVVSQFEAELHNNNSPIPRQLAKSIQSHLDESLWNTTGAGTSAYAYLDVDIIAHHLSEYALDRNCLRVWIPEHDGTAGLLEIRCELLVRSVCGIDVYIEDSIDGGTVRVGHEDITRMTDLEVRGYVRITGPLANTDIGSWDISFEFSPGDYDVEIGELSVNYHARDYGEYDVAYVDSAPQDEYTLPLFPESS